MLLQVKCGTEVVLTDSAPSAGVLVRKERRKARHRPEHTGTVGRKVDEIAS